MNLGETLSLTLKENQPDVLLSSPAGRELGWQPRRSVRCDGVCRDKLCEPLFSSLCVTKDLKQHVRIKSVPF